MPEDQLEQQESIPDDQILILTGSEDSKKVNEAEDADEFDRKETGSPVKTKSVLLYSLLYLLRFDFFRFILPPHILSGLQMKKLLIRIWKQLKVKSSLPLQPFL